MQPDKEGAELQEQVVSKLGLDARELRMREQTHVAMLQLEASQRRWVRAQLTAPCSPASTCTKSFLQMLYSKISLQKPTVRGRAMHGVQCKDGATWGGTGHRGG